MSGTDPKGGNFRKIDPTRTPGGGNDHSTVPGNLPKIPGITLQYEIARGGMGVVYAGRQDFLDRRVAVKFLSVDLGGASFAQRFQREAKILAGIKHTNIVACHMADTTAEGQSYLVMEFIDGPSLKGWIRENGPTSANAALRLIRATAQALGHAHQMDIIHRDVKPENILLESVTSTAIDIHFPFTPKLVDLGLARMTHEQVGAGLTSPGSVMGTPSTMSPEQFDDPDSVDFRSDIYGLGCVLYEMLVGAPAFRSGKLTDIVTKKREAMGPDPCAENPAVHPRVGALTRRMMACDRNQRPSSYKELDELLNELMKVVAADGVRTDTIVSGGGQGGRVVGKPGSDSAIERTVPAPSRIEATPPAPAEKPASGARGGLLDSGEFAFLADGGAPNAKRTQFHETGDGTTPSGGRGGKSKAPLFAIGGLVAVAAAVGIFFATRGGGDDGGGGSGGDNRLPVIAAIEGPSKVDLDGRFTLKVVASDPDGDKLSYDWRFPMGVVATTRLDQQQVGLKIEDGLPGVPFDIVAEVGEVGDGIAGHATVSSTHRVTVGDCPIEEPLLGFAGNPAWRRDRDDNAWQEIPDPKDRRVRCLAKRDMRTMSTALGDENYWEWFGSIASENASENGPYATVGLHFDFGNRGYGIRCTRSGANGEKWRVEVVKCLDGGNGFQCEPLAEPRFVEWQVPEDSDDDFRGWFSVQRRGNHISLQVGETRLPFDSQDGTEAAPRTAPVFEDTLPEGAKPGDMSLVVDQGRGLFRLRRR
ncbi:MAG: serine/threonine protein kinase [Planctomycetes bacterium]|nr:serine/threonine protein kinase [Planctomycetota bacterium]